MRCGSGMFIRLPNQDFFYPRFRGQKKHRIRIFNPKNCYQALKNTIGDVKKANMNLLEKLIFSRIFRIFLI